MIKDIAAQNGRQQFFHYTKCMTSIKDKSSFSSKINHFFHMIFFVDFLSAFDRTARLLKSVSSADSDTIYTIYIS